MTLVDRYVELLPVPGKTSPPPPCRNFGGIINHQYLTLWVFRVSSPIVRIFTFLSNFVLVTLSISPTFYLKALFFSSVRRFVKSFFIWFQPRSFGLVQLVLFVGNFRICLHDA